MPILAVTRADELDELFERAHAEFDVLKEARELRDARSDLVRQIEEIDRKLAKFDAPLRRMLTRPGGVQTRSRSIEDTVGHGG